MKKILLACALLASTAFASTAFADQNNTSIAGAEALSVSGASAGASLKTGDVFANGGIGAASCTDSFGTPIFSFSQSRRACEVMQGAMSMFDRGLMTKAEARAFGLESLKMSGVVLVAPPAAATATTASSMSAPPAAAKPQQMTVNAPWDKLSRAQQTAVCAGELYWNEKKYICN